MKFRDAINRKIQETYYAGKTYDPSFVPGVVVDIEDAVRKLVAEVIGEDEWTFQNDSKEVALTKSELNGLREEQRNRLTAALGEKGETE